MKIKSYIFVLSLFVSFASASDEARIKNRTEAIAAAEPVLIAKFGKDEIKRQHPFRVRLIRNRSEEFIWIVEGALHKAPSDIAVFGGVVFTAVREKDGQVIEVFMWK